MAAPADRVVWDYAGRRTKRLGQDTRSKSQSTRRGLQHTFTLMACAEMSLSSLSNKVRSMIVVVVVGASAYQWKGKK